MQVGDKIYTPRFCTVEISQIFSSMEDAVSNGFTESAHYNDGQFAVYGKSVGVNRMVFSAVKEEV